MAEKADLDMWAELEEEIAAQEAGNQQGSPAPVTGVRSRASITDRPVRPNDTARLKVTEIVRHTRPFEAPRQENDAEIRNTKPFGKGISIAPKQTHSLPTDKLGIGTHSNTIPAGRPENLVPLSDITPLRGIAHEDLKATRSAENLFRRVNSRIPEQKLDSILRAPTREMSRDEKASLAPDRPRSDAPIKAEEQPNNQVASLAELALPLIHEAGTELASQPDSFDPLVDPRPTMLPPKGNTIEDLIAAVKIAVEARSAAQRATDPNTDEESIVTSEPILAQYHIPVDKTPSIIIDDEHCGRDYYVTDPKQPEAPWWKRLGNKMKETATKVSRTIRETFQNIFNLRTSTRRNIASVLAAASFGVIAGLHGKPTTNHNHTDAPVVQVAPTASVAPTLVPTVDTENQVTTIIDQTPIVTHSATVIVDEHSPHITFVQALTSFLTSSSARAQLASYSHHTGDAIRVLHSLEHNRNLADTASHLRYGTHRGDRFNFAVMSDGSIQLNHWHSRHSEENKLSAPITFALPRR